jgi:alpha-beta hydrolase superfamily lysophospholipase
MINFRAERTPTRMRNVVRLFVAAIGLAAVLAPSAASASPHRPGGLHCSVHYLHVAISDPGPASQIMWGQLCYRGGRQPRAVQLLVHGVTYDHLYWNFPYGHGYYSYVDAATAAGYATFSIDRIGDGRSSHPPGAEVTVAAGAVAVHDAISDLRSGEVSGRPFRYVIWVGHSFGSLTGWVEISRYHDVNAAILTGALNGVNANLGSLLTSFYPADQDPKFAHSGLDSDYLTTVPGTRAALFYDPPTASPAVVALDEKLKQTLATGEFAILPEVILPPGQAITHGITVPVLLVDGQEDGFFCTGVAAYNCADPASVLSYERQCFPPQARLQVAIIPDTGHDLALSTTAPITDAIMLAWARHTIAP